MKTSYVVVAAAVWTGWAAAAVEPALGDGAALRGLDPVALTAGREVAGDPDRVVERGKFRYAFATEENRKAFEKDPDRYAIQFGGACMRMGPLAGGGDPARFLVHDGRIYIFASNACRESFKSAPERFVDVADEVPKGSSEDAAKADALLRKAVEGFGGEAVLKGLKSIQVDQEVQLSQGGQEYRSKRTVVTAFPLVHVNLEDYGTSRYRWLVDSEAGYLTWDSSKPVDDSVRSYMLREVYRQPVVLLKAWLNGDAKAVYLGAEKVGNVEAGKVAVAVLGATTTLLIDPETGTVLRAMYRGRSGGVISDLAREYSDYRSVNGLKMPHAVRRFVGGKATENPKVTVTAIRVNAETDPKLLVRP